MKLLERIEDHEVFKDRSNYRQMSPLFNYCRSVISRLSPPCTEVSGVYRVIASLDNALLRWTFLYHAGHSFITLDIPLYVGHSFKRWTILCYAICSIRSLHIE